MEKLDEGGFNRIFLITMLDGFQMIACILYPVTEPKFYAVASEVAKSDGIYAGEFTGQDPSAYLPLFLQHGISRNIGTCSQLSL